MTRSMSTLCYVVLLIYGAPAALDGLTGPGTILGSGCNTVVSVPEYQIGGQQFKSGLLYFLF